MMNFIIYAYAFKYIMKFLGVNSLNNFRLTGKDQRDLVDDVRIMWINNEGKVPQDLGFEGNKSYRHFKKYIKNHKNKDLIIKQGQNKSIEQGRTSCRMWLLFL